MLVFRVTAYWGGQRVSDTFEGEIEKALEVFEFKTGRREDNAYVSLSVIEVDEAASPINLLNRTRFASKEIVIKVWQKEDSDVA